MTELLTLFDLLEWRDELVESYSHGMRQKLIISSAFVHRPEVIVVLAVDMPRVTPATLRRLREAAEGHDGAFLHDREGRRQLAGVIDAGRLDAVRPDLEGQHGMALHRLLAPLRLAQVASSGDEAVDIDSWADLRDLR